MGTLISRLKRLNSSKGPAAVENSREYSWDKNRKLNVQDYSFNNICDEVAGKLPGSVNGQQFTIQNCSNSTLYVFDYMNTVTIDDCDNCTFILGPIKESIFIRDCKSCLCIASSGQFRTRDCTDVDIYLCCATQPIIEASLRLKFNCLQFYYEDLSDHMRNAGLSPFNNLWNNVHDFTPGDQEAFDPDDGDHWRIISHVSSPQISICGHQDFESIALSFSPEKSVIPHTAPPSVKDLKMGSNQSLESKPNACLVVFSPESVGQNDSAMLFYRTMRRLHPQCQLSSSKELFMKPDHPFAKNAFGKNFKSGLIVGLRFFGYECWEACEKVTEQLSREVPECKGQIHLRKCCMRELCTQDDFFNTPAPYIPAFSG